MKSSVKIEETFLILVRMEVSCLNLTRSYLKFTRKHHTAVPESAHYTNTVGLLFLSGVVLRDGGKGEKDGILLFIE